MTLYARTSCTSRALLLLLCLALAQGAPVQGQSAGEIRVDGQVVGGSRYIVLSGEAWFPIVELGRHLGVPVTVDGSGRVASRRTSVTTSVRQVNGVSYVPRSVIRQVLGVRVFVDESAGRAALTSERALAQAARQVARTSPNEGQPRAGAGAGAVRTSSTQDVPYKPSQGPPAGQNFPPPPTNSPPPLENQGPPPLQNQGPPPLSQGGSGAPGGGPGGSPQGGPGGSPQGGPGGSARAHSGPPVLQVYDVNLDRDATRGNMLRVRARVRNISKQALRGVTLTFLLWDDGQPTATCPMTGEVMGTGGVYSTYPLSVGDLQPGDVRALETTTTVASPRTIESALITIDMPNYQGSRAYDQNGRPVIETTNAFSYRKLRFGFKATSN